MKMKSNTTKKLFRERKEGKKRKRERRAKNKETGRGGGVSVLPPCTVRPCPSDPLVFPHVGSWG